MASITGSGKFVAIAASATILDDVFSNGIKGLTFGTGSSQYVRISQRYITQNSVVTGDALCIDPIDSNHELALYFPALRKVLVKDEYNRVREAYTGTINVACDCTLYTQGSNTAVLTNYKDYIFKNGLLTNAYRT